MKTRQVTHFELQCDTTGTLLHQVRGKKKEQQQQKEMQ